MRWITRVSYRRRVSGSTFVREMPLVLGETSEAAKLTDAVARRREARAGDPGERATAVGQMDKHLAHAVREVRLGDRSGPVELRDGRGPALGRMADLRGARRDRLGADRVERGMCDRRAGRCPHRWWMENLLPLRGCASQRHNVFDSLLERMPGSIDLANQTLASLSQRTHCREAPGHKRHINTRPPEPTTESPEQR